MSTNLFDEDFKEFVESSKLAGYIPAESKECLRTIAFAFWVKGAQRTMESQRKGSMKQLLESMLTEAVSTEGDAQ